jgi:GAF domain-containing protein
LEFAVGIASTADGPAIRKLLEGLVAVHLRSAAILRANGRATEAARIEQFASRTRLRLEHPNAVQRMRALIQTVYESSHTSLLLERALDGAITLTEADFGNLQLRDRRNGGLRIATQSGFDSEFLEYFAVLDDNTSACGRAASQCAQMVIFDVNEDAGFTPHRDIAAASRFRGVQSTPLVDPTGRLTGVISTHFRDPHRPCDRELQLMQWYAEEVAAALAHQQKRPTTLYDASARLHAQTAELQESAAALIHEDARYC